MFETIKLAQPSHLFVAADGPRDHVEGEKERCEQARAVIDAVDWDCEVKVLFRDENLGCGVAVSSAISWFFDQVEEGIILEDDCMAHPAFFGYCQDLLEAHRVDRRVMMIGGTNFLPEEQQKIKKAHFSRCPMVWGWATWRSAWKLYDKSMSQLPDLIRSGKWKGLHEDTAALYYWMRCFCKCVEIDTWDYQWFYSILVNDGIVANAGVNLIQNIGIGEDSTHTSNGYAPILTDIEEKDFLALPVTSDLIVDEKFDHMMHDRIYDVYLNSRSSALVRWWKMARKKKKTERLMRGYVSRLG